MTHDVFISHSSKDKSIADAVCAAVEAAKIRCWIAPRDIMPGDKWAAAITKAISNSRIMILIFSEHSNNSEDVLNELLLAKDAGAIIIPFKIGDIIPKGEMEYYLKRTHWLDAMNPPTEKQIQRLVETVGNFSKNESPGNVEISEDEKLFKENEANKKLRIEGQERKERGEKADDEKISTKKLPLYNSIFKNNIFVIAVVLGILIIGYGVFANSSNESEPLKQTPSPTPKVTVIQTPKSTPTPSQTSAVSQTSIQKAINSIAFALIPAGEFNMGLPSNDPALFDEGPIHHVKISTAFYMGKYEVTQKQWSDVMGNNPSQFKGDKLPVEQVSWEDVQDFIKKLNDMESTNKYRLPTEAEWEYAARERTTTRYFFGNDESELGNYAWYYANSGSMTHEVGQKNPSPWGLYDMSGNVYEWVQDKYHNSYGGAPTDGSSWESGTGSTGVFRGGGFACDGGGCWPTTRHILPGAPIGFRLVKDL